MKMLILILLNKLLWNLHGSTLSPVTRKAGEHGMGRKVVPLPAVCLLAEEPISLVPMRFALNGTGGVQSAKYFPLTLFSENRWL